MALRQPGVDRAAWNSWEEPPVLRFFMGRLRAKSDWPEKLAAKFRQDFGDSL